jgi:hypothetical protein
LVEHWDINIDPKNLQHLAHSFCEWWPVHLLDKIGGEKKKKKKQKKAPQSGTNYFPKCTILPFSFFFLFLSLKSIRKCAKPLTILLGKLCNPTQWSRAYSLSNNVKDFASSCWKIIMNFF